MNLETVTLPSALALSLTACSGTPPLRGPADYPTLSIKADEPNTRVFVKPGIDLRRYRKVFVAPVAVQTGEEGARTDVGDDEAKAVARHAGQALKDRLSRSRQRVAAPGIDAAAAFGRWSAAEKILDNAAERLAADLDDTRSGKRLARAVDAGTIRRESCLDALTPPAQVTAGLPAELLQRRPDIRAAEESLRGAGANLDATRQ